MIHKRTRRLPNEKYINQIDHILINLRFCNCIQDVRTLRGAYNDFDFFVNKEKHKERKTYKARSIYRNCTG